MNGYTLLNIKMSRGDRDVILASEVWGELFSIWRQRAVGLAPSAGPARSSKSPTDVRQLVADLK